MSDFAPLATGGPAIHALDIGVDMLFGVRAAPGCARLVGPEDPGGVMKKRPLRGSPNERGVPELSPWAAVADEPT